ncbi:MAG: indole-3-glycerol phosphate synthase TrpC [Methylacidiphilales bacterium]|nr:indole-3-glycerol phosphate synthase TrpC [Candidatus Methylacidiphilales bacterium]
MNQLHTIVDDTKKHLESKINQVSLAEMKARALDCDPQRNMISQAIKDANRMGHLGVIAEFKRASPSAGVFNPIPQLKNQVQVYQDAGAHALSILTNQTYFGGSIHDIYQAKQFSSLPILRKDFIVSQWQVYESRLIGVSSILLIAEILSTAELIEYHELAESIGLEALVEVHSLEDTNYITRAMKFIGINNRNLKTMKTDLGQTMLIKKQIHHDCVVISESGIRERGDAEFVSKQGVHGMLIGESLLRESNPAGKLALFATTPFALE